ncbi:hypothetical protein F5B19DRAFT_425843 [Rostrohypoxylon terebratum]|nr:hypothetical protein F5B19DRAFT_425843 [Rostrohypoxylon terebratum]
MIRLLIARSLSLAFICCSSAKSKSKVVNSRHPIQCQSLDSHYCFSCKSSSLPVIQAKNRMLHASLMLTHDECLRGVPTSLEMLSPPRYMCRPE